jgi:hypothetical protein
MRTAAFIVVEIGLLAVTHVVGGPAWVAVAAVACLAHVAFDVRGRSLAAALPALVWLAASRMTGNRELFFPYAMLLATSALLAAPPERTAGGLAAAAIVAAAFLATRVVQQASGRVLAVELVAAVAVLAAAGGVQAMLPPRAGRWWLPAAASLMAWACLSI